MKDEPTTENLNPYSSLTSSRLQLIDNLSCGFRSSSARIFRTSVSDSPCCSMRCRRHLLPFL
jgi:hypothetical protein